MSKEKEGKEKSVKKAPTKNLKEKRAAKAAKREEKKRGWFYLVVYFYSNKGKQFFDSVILSWVSQVCFHCILHNRQINAGVVFWENRRLYSK